jgi:molybdopterin synthase catalytic subunit
MARVTVSITDGPIDCVSAIAVDPDIDAGAVITFLGVVRRQEQDKTIDGLSYQTYDPMAKRVLHALADEALVRFEVEAVHVEHSRGIVLVGECSFRLMVAGVHRREAIDAVDWFIARMKESAPIWKTPVFLENNDTIREPKSIAFHEMRELKE